MLFRSVEAACEDLNRHDLVAFGKKMNETHDGLSKDYGVSCDELDFLAEKAQQTEGVWGSRMMGGGFGGCTINLVKTEAISAFIEKMTAAYKDAYDIDLKTYTVMISDGTTIY